MPDNFIVNTSMTLEMCFGHCLKAGKQYAGTQYFKQCFCGSYGVDFDRHGAADQAECNLQCRGNAEQICGGSWRMSVYDLTPGMLFFNLALG